MHNPHQIYSNMTYYESFYVRKINKAGKVVYFLRNLDLSRIESWEWVDRSHTKIFTKSGDVFIARVSIGDLTDNLMELNDEYGKLFKFYLN